jgi:broad specificity phosphatase PhoE
MHIIAYTPDPGASVCFLHRCLQDPWNFSPPGGESQRQVEERIKAYIMEEVMPVVKAGGPPAIVVGHGLAIRW